MKNKPVVRIAKSMEGLDRLLEAIEEKRSPKPDWIHLQGECRLDRLPTKKLKQVVRRLHGCVLRGFRARNVHIKSKAKRLEYWRTVARNGFHDFSDHGWMKAYDSPFLEDHDYITPYLQRGIDALDPYAIYSAVLGTHDYSVEDFVTTKICSEVRTIAEPMAGTAEFSYYGHFRYPEFTYVMFDLDEDAQKGVLARPWLEGTNKHYLVADVLEEEVWQEVGRLGEGRSLAYIGKQSHHLFNAVQLHRLMDVACRNVDFLMLETPQVSLVSDMEDSDDLTREEMEDAGFEVGLEEEPGGMPNPFTNEMAFRLEVSDKRGDRSLFRYHGWTNWNQPTLVAYAQLLGLTPYYYHPDREDFVSVQEDTDTSDCLDNVTFMLFTRHG